MQEQGRRMSSNGKLSSANADIYEQLTTARNYLRKLDDLYARAAAAHNTTFEHYQVLLAVHCLGEGDVPLRILAEHLVRDRTATGQLCKRMQQIGLIELTYESNSHRPQLLVALSQRGKEVLKAITEDGLRNRDLYLNTLPPDKRMYLAEAVRFSWLEGLEQSSSISGPQSSTGH
jgi:DNA-binding MarR family transcriptional regulator